MGVLLHISRLTFRGSNDPMIRKNPIVFSKNSTAGWRAAAPLRWLCVALLLATFGICPAVEVRGQGQAQPEGTARPAPKKKYTLRVTNEGITGVSLKADKGKLSGIAVDLSKRLGAKVILGPTTEKEAITVEF